MKKTTIFLIIISLLLIGFNGCKAKNIDSETDEYNAQSTTDEGEKAMELITKLAGEPLSDAIELYFLTSAVPQNETLLEVEKAEQEISLVLKKLNDKDGIHDFSEEAEDLINQMTFSANQVIKYKRMQIEDRNSDNIDTDNKDEDNIEKVTDPQQEYFDEITNIADLMREYEKLYKDFKANK